MYDLLPRFKDFFEARMNATDGPLVLSGPQPCPRSERKFGCPLDAWSPPSTGRITPLTKTASSLARNAITPATSSGVAALPIGRRSRKAAMTDSTFSRSIVASVEVRLGATALIRTPREPYSRAKARVKFVTAPLAALYELIHQSPPRPDADERLTMEPFVFRR